MNNSIYPCITIRNQINEAASFYIEVFGEGRILNTSPWVTQIELSGQKFMLLNDGPSSSPNPAISFMVMSNSAEQIEDYWNKLMESGRILMPLDNYAWSKKYGWLQDKYGVSWQLYTGDGGEIAQKFSPTLMFTGPKVGKAAEAVHYYSGLFPDSRIDGIMNYTKADGENPEYVKHSQFSISNYTLMAMDSSLEHGFTFNDAISLVVECDTQMQIDTYWEALTSDGGKEVACGWLTDKYGISWQIIPNSIISMVTDPERAQKMMPVMMKMKKLVIADLENA